MKITGSANRWTVRDLNYPEGSASIENGEFSIALLTGADSVDGRFDVEDLEMPPQLAHEICDLLNEYTWTPDVTG